MSFTYAEVGATRGTLPAGYDHQSRRTYLGRGVLAQAAEHLLSWQVFREGDVDVAPTTPRVREGSDVTVPLPVGPFRVPARCRVVWTQVEERRVGFAFGTLPGHAVSGEASFVVEEDADGGTWFTITSFSRPAAWYARLGAPVVRRVQQAAKRRYLRAMERLVIPPRLTYDEVGATKGQLPAGYSYIRERMRIGTGVLAEATEHLMTWQMYRAAGVRVRTPHPRITVGTDVVVVLGLGRFGVWAPCRIVWTLAEERRAGFAYGTLDGHPESGEESFVLEEDESGATWLTITSFSRPVAWYARLGGPVTRCFQRLFVRRCLQVMRRLCEQ